jgi:hypothetical protein
VQLLGQTRKAPARRHRDPDSRSRPNREPGNPCFPIPGRIGKQGFPVSRFPPNRESGIPRFPILARPKRELGIPARFPAKSGIGGTGIGDLGLWRTELATSHWLPLLTCVGGRKSAFSRIKGNIWPPDRHGVWYSHGMSIPDFPIFGQNGNRGFPHSRFWPNRESGIPSPISGGNLKIPRFRVPAKSGIGGTGIGDFRAGHWHGTPDGHRGWG